MTNGVRVTLHTKTCEKIQPFNINTLFNESNQVHSTQVKENTDDAINTLGLDVTPAVMKEILSVNTAGWRDEIPLIEEHFKKFGDKLPQGLRDELQALRNRLEKA